MKKIIFGITSLTLGGAERVLVDIANKLCDKYDITIFTLYGSGCLEKQLSPKVKVNNMISKSYNELTSKEKIMVSLKILFWKKSLYKKYINNQYDVEVAFLEGPITRLFSVINNNTSKIAWIHNDIRLVFGQGIKAKIKKILDKGVYKKYEKLVFVSKDNLKKFNETYNITNEKCVIYNYLNKQNVLGKSVMFNPNFETENNFVTVSRLVEQKAIDRLIEVHTKLLHDGYAHTIYVIGDGPLKDKLQKMIDERDISDSFKLIGAKENPYPYIKYADYFCLFSYFEGYPMVIEEAKVLNKRILITDTAARENLEDYSNCVIADNSDEGIYCAIKDELDNRIKNDDIVNYEDESILIQIEELLN